jgi:hypothetical protein
MALLFVNDRCSFYLEISRTVDNMSDSTGPSLLVTFCQLCDQHVRVCPPDISLINDFAIEDGGYVLCPKCKCMEIVIPYQELVLSIWPKLMEARVRRSCQTLATKILMKKQIGNSIGTGVPNTTYTPRPNTSSATVNQSQEDGRKYSAPLDQTYSNQRSKKFLLHKP